MSSRHRQIVGLTLGALLATSALFAWATALSPPAEAQQTPEETCAGLKSNPSAYQQCVETVRKSQALTASPQPTGSSSAPVSPSDSQEASRAAQRRQMMIAIGASLAVAALAIGFSILRTVRRASRYPVDEITVLMEGMIPPEVRDANRQARAVPIPRAGGKTAGWLMVLSVVIAAAAIAGGILISRSVFSGKIWVVPIILLPFGVGYAWWVTRKASKSSDAWLAPLGLHVEKTPAAIAGPNPAGMAGGNIMRPYVVGPTVIAGRRHGREVTITQESTGIGPVSIRTLVKGASPRLSVKGERGSWSGEIPDGPVGEAIRGARIGPGSLTLAGDGQGLVAIRMVSGHDLLSPEGYGLSIRDLNLVESVIDAEGR